MSPAKLATSSASCWRSSMANRHAPLVQHCIENIRHSKVKLTDPGTGKTAILLNSDRGQVRRIRVDGCLAPPNRPAADWIASKAQVVDVIVELKGTNVGRAIVQVQATLDFWTGHAEHEQAQPIGAWILCSEYPRASTKVAGYRESVRIRGAILLISTHNGEERDFAEFVPKRP